MTSYSDSFTGSSATRRRARLRRRSRQREIVSALTLFVSLVDAALSTKTKFGRLLACAHIDTDLRQEGKVSSRDLFPLPLISDCSVAFLRDLPISGTKCLVSLVNASVIGLNFLHGISEVSLPRIKINSAQRASLNSLVMRWWRLGKHISSSECELAFDTSAFEQLVSRKQGSRSTPLRAECLDQLDKCALVDPMCFLPAEVQEVIENPQVLFNASPDDFTPHVRFGSGSRAEYCLLLRKEFRIGKIVFGLTCKNAASVFAVNKSSPGKQREEWDGGGLSKLTLTPPSPPWLCTPSSLCTLECSDDIPLRMSVRDGTCFFDQLSLPQCLREYIAKPYITVRELCDFDYKGNRVPGQEPLSFEELKAAIVESEAGMLHADSILYPLSTCWPMGHSWSSMVAQHTMTGACLEAGIRPEQFLCESNGLPLPGVPRVSVATDDIILFERLSGAAFEHEGSASYEFSELDKVWATHGILGKEDKHLDRVLSGTALGMSLVQGKFIMPKAARLVNIVCAIRCLLERPITSPKKFGCFFGLLQWILLINRPLLACCEQVYTFIDADDEVERAIPVGVLSELSLVGCLLVATVVDLRRPWTPFVSATDGAESFGYGGACAKCNPMVVREIVSHAENLSHTVLPADAIQSAQEDAHWNDAYIMPLKMSDFKSVFSLKSDANFHASKLEIGAVGIGLKGIVRKARYHGTRTAFLVDSQAVLYAARKGRSSAPNLRYGARVIASLSLAAELQVHYAYIPSRYNPSDLDSRGIRRRPSRSKPRESKLFERVGNMRRALRCLRRAGLITAPGESLWESSCSLSCYGQPSN